MIALYFLSEHYLWCSNFGKLRNLREKIKIVILIKRNNYLQPAFLLFLV